MADPGGMVAGFVGAPQLDQSANYNTPLSPAQETEFQRWRATLPSRLQSMADYDLRGAWKASAQAASNGHLPDTFKKPNHPTFSDESIYSGPYTPGGQWVPLKDGAWRFIATPQNLKYRSADDLRQYFQTQEPGNILVLPPSMTSQPPPSGPGAMTAPDRPRFGFGAQR